MVPVLTFRHYLWGNEESLFGPGEPSDTFPDDERICTYMFYCKVHRGSGPAELLSKMFSPTLQMMLLKASQRAVRFPGHLTCT